MISSPKPTATATYGAQLAVRRWPSATTAVDPGAGLRGSRDREQCDRDHPQRIDRVAALVGRVQLDVAVDQVRGDVEQQSRDHELQRACARRAPSGAEAQIPIRRAGSCPRPGTRSRRRSTASRGRPGAVSARAPRTSRPSRRRSPRPRDPTSAAPARRDHVGPPGNTAGPTASTDRTTGRAHRQPTGKAAGPRAHRSFARCRPPGTRSTPAPAAATPTAASAGRCIVVKLPEPRSSPRLPRDRRTRHRSASGPRPANGTAASRRRRAAAHPFQRPSAPSDRASLRAPANAPDLRDIRDRAHGRPVPAHRP